MATCTDSHLSGNDTDVSALLNFVMRWSFSHRDSLKCVEYRAYFHQWINRHRSKRNIELIEAPIKRMTNKIDFKIWLGKWCCCRCRCCCSHRHRRGMSVACHHTSRNDARFLEQQIRLCFICQYIDTVCFHGIENRIYWWNMKTYRLDGERTFYLWFMSPHLYVCTNNAASISLEMLFHQRLCSND